MEYDDSGVIFEIGMTIRIYIPNSIGRLERKRL
jgi:hypothetical protein